MSASGVPLGKSREQSEQLAASMAATQQQFRSLAEAFVVSLRPAVEETERRMAAFLEGLLDSLHAATMASMYLALAADAQRFGELPDATAAS